MNSAETLRDTYIYCMTDCQSEDREVASRAPSIACLKGIWEDKLQIKLRSMQSLCLLAGTKGKACPRNGNVGYSLSLSDVE